MAAEGEQRVRKPCVAGRFYPDDPNACRAEAKSYVAIDRAALDTSHQWIGGLVPHAGWICSGAIAGLTIATVAAVRQPELVVVFGAIHTPLTTDLAALDENRSWSEPGSETEIASTIRAKLIESRGPIVTDERFHEREHAIEVELPLLKEAFPEARLLPVEVPPNANAPEIGRVVAKTIAKENLNAIFLASTDLTHYGPSYRFTPAGIGEAAIQWSMGNDRRFLDLVEKMNADAVVPEARSRMSACGAGAVAATIAACKELGADNVRTLKHTNSYAVLRDVMPQRPVDAVGYASVVIG